MNWNQVLFHLKRTHTVANCSIIFPFLDGDQPGKNFAGRYSLMFSIISSFGQGRKKNINPNKQTKKITDEYSSRKLSSNVVGISELSDGTVSIWPIDPEWAVPPSLITKAFYHMSPSPASICTCSRGLEVARWAELAESSIMQMGNDKTSCGMQQ